MLVLRLLVVLLTSFTLFSDDQGRFICNTIQPGCSNVCFDVFAPVSVFHLWLFHFMLLCLPHVLFATYVTHKVLSDPDFGAFYCISSRGGSPFTLETSVSSRELSLHKVQLNNLPHGCGTPRFYCAYLLTVILRIVLEAFFGAGQFLIFGLSIPKSFLCYEAPCNSGVECFISKPTEKTLMLNFMLGVYSLSILLSLVDLLSSIKAMGRWRAKKAMLMEEMSKGEQSSMFTMTGTAEDRDVLLTRRISPSESSNDAVKNGNPNAGGSNGELLDTKVFSASIIQTEESACDKFHSPTPMNTPVPAHFNLHSHLRGAPLNPRVPALLGVKNLGLYSPVAANSGQQSDNGEPQDKRAWV